MSAQGVRLVRGGLTGAIYAVTKWKPNPRGVHVWEAIEKIDVTDDFERLALELGWSRPTESDEWPGLGVVPPDTIVPPDLTETIATQPTEVSS